jgi:hypothetical protein
MTKDYRKPVNLRETVRQADRQRTSSNILQSQLL